MANVCEKGRSKQEHLLWKDQGYKLKSKETRETCKIEPGYDTFFQNKGLFQEFNAYPDKTIIHTLYPDFDFNINFQGPHTDNEYFPSKKGLEISSNYSWTAHMPFIMEGSWISPQFGTGEWYTMKRPFGKVLLLHSDVVYGGGMPIIEHKKGNV